jgi:membrane-associated phospholipid phosphatase
MSMISKHRVAPRGPVKVGGGVVRVPRLERVVVGERRVLRQLGLIESVGLDEVLPWLSRAADHGVLWIGIAGTLALTGRSGRVAAARGLQALSVASATTTVFKQAADRGRPPAGLVPTRRRPRRAPFTASFPSGHAAGATAFATAVVCELPWAAVPLVPLSAAVAASRVVIGVHYPSDVAAGVALGVVVAVVTRRHFGDGRARRPERKGRRRGG